MTEVSALDTFQAARGLIYQAQDEIEEKGDALDANRKAILMVEVAMSGKAISILLEDIPKAEAEGRIRGKAIAIREDGVTKEVPIADAITSMMADVLGTAVDVMSTLRDGMDWDAVDAHTMAEMIEELADVIDEEANLAEDPGMAIDSFMPLTPETDPTKFN